MARLGAIATGNFTDASTWGVIDTTAAWVIDSEAGTLSITNSTSTHISPSATPGAITIDGVYLKIQARGAGASGTFTVVLRNTTAGSDVTSVVINVADIPTGSAGLSAGWEFFQFSAPQTLLAATNYAIRVTCSNSGEVVLWRSTASAQEFSRLIRTTTTAAPGAGDQMIITNAHTGTGAYTGVVVTMDNTASTTFGATSYVDSLSISGGGILRYGTSGSTNYLLTVAGLTSVWAGSEFSIGTSGSRIPSSSTATFVMASATNVDSGIKTVGTGIFNAYGNIITSVQTLQTASIGGYCTTSGTTVTRVLGQSFTGLTGTIRINGVNYTISSVTNANTLVLTGSAGTQSSPVAYTHSGTANVLTVGDTTDWAANHEIVVASTSQTAADSELATIQSVDSSTQVTLTGSLTNQHSGDSPTQAEVIHLTRNVVIRGVSTSLQGYFLSGSVGAVINFSYVEFKWMGSSTANKRGIDIVTTTGGASFTAIGCSFHDFTTGNAIGLNVSGSSVNGISVTYCNFWKISTNCISQASTSGTNITYDHIIAIKNTSSAIFSFLDIGGTITNITAVGATTTGIAINETSTTTTAGTISNLTAHSCTSAGITISAYSATMSNLTIWRNGSVTTVTSSSSVYLDGYIAFGNVTSNFAPNSSADITLNNAVLSGDNIFSTTNGVSIGGACGNIYVTNSTLGVVSGIKTAHTSGDVQGSSAPINYILRNCILASSTEVTSQTSMQPANKILSQKHDQTAGLHKRWERFGTAVIDTTTYRTASPAETLTPNNATNKFKSSEKQVVVANSGTATVTVYVYKSASYNGAQPRLICRRNEAIGSNSDTVLATASGGTGSWLTLSGTTPTATDDGAFVCYVDCDGTVGTVTVDDWSVS